MPQNMLQVVWGCAMSNLPNPNEFKNHQATFIPIERSQTGSKGYDLVQMDKNFKVALKGVESLVKRKLSNEFYNHIYNLNKVI